MPRAVSVLVVPVPHSLFDRELASLLQMEDHHNSRVAEEYYGYHDEGIEYGGWVNGRSMASSSRSGSRSSTRTSRVASEGDEGATPVASKDAQSRAYRGWSDSGDSARQRR